MPTVSIIIPAYEAHETIRSAIDSALGQTSLPPDARVEVVVIDDGSPTDLAPALTSYGHEVRCLRQLNAGAAAARNTGIGLAGGEIIAFLDADDTWEPQRLARQLALFAAEPQLGMLASVYFKQAPWSSNRTLHKIDPSWLDRTMTVSGEELFTVASLIWTGTVLLRREALGDDRFVSGLEPAEDRDLWLRIIRRARVRIISEPLATAVLVPGSLSRKDPDSGYEPMIRVLRRHAALVSPRSMRRLEAGVYRAWASAHLDDRRPARAIAPAKARLARQPFSPQAWWILAKALTSAAILRLKPIRYKDGRDETALRRHFHVERELAARVRHADADRRRTLYGEVYNELFQRVADHPQNTRKHSTGAQEAATRWQWRLLRNFVKPESRYLELGAGDCHLAMHVARRARCAVGMDVSNVIATSDDPPDNFSLVISDGVRIDVPPAAVDIAYSCQLMEHLHPDDAAAQLAQVRLALAPGGRYICVTPHRHSGPHDVSRFFATEACGFHLKEYTYEELRDLLLAAGFDSTETWAGVKGRFFKHPTRAVEAMERVIGVLPRALRRFVASRLPLLRNIFINVIVVGRVNAKSAAAQIVIDTDAHAAEVAA